MRILNDINQSNEQDKSRYRNNLPQLCDEIFITDGGLETTLIFHQDTDLPYFAAFDLLREQRGIDILKGYYHQYTATDIITALTLTYSDEATGITQAAQAAGIPIAVPFTVATDGHLPSGESIFEAINTVDTVTNNGPAYYMINCAHPSNFKEALATNATWLKRIRGIR